MLGDALFKAVWAWKEVSKVILGPTDDEIPRSNPTDMAGLSALCPVLTTHSSPPPNGGGGDTSPNTFATRKYFPQQRSNNRHRMPNSSSSSRRQLKKHHHLPKLKTGCYDNNIYTIDCDPLYQTNNPPHVNIPIEQEDGVVREAPRLREPRRPSSAAELVTVVTSAVEDLSHQDDQTYGVCDALYGRGICRSFQSSGADSGLVSYGTSASDTRCTSTSENHHAGTVMRRAMHTDTVSSGFSQSSHIPPPQSPIEECIPSGDHSPVPFRPMYDQCLAPVISFTRAPCEDSLPCRRDDPAFLPPVQRQKRLVLPSDPSDYNVFPEEPADQVTTPTTTQLSPAALSRTSDPCNPFEPSPAPVDDVNDPLGHVDSFEYAPPDRGARPREILPSGAPTPRRGGCSRPHQPL